MVNKLKIQNSYIFLNNLYKKEEKKGISKRDGTVVVTLHNSIDYYISNSFPKLKQNKDSNNHFRWEYHCDVQVESSDCKVKFIINEVVNVTYLDVIVEGKTKVQIIKCLEQIQDILLSSGVRDNYIIIISYDAISEYYCNKILPKLNSLERNLRQLLYNIYIVNFNQEYYKTTISQDLQNKIKSRIRPKGNKKQKEIESVQLFFYNLEFSDMQELLFEPKWIDIDKKAMNSFLDNHTDLSLLSDEELRKAFFQITPKSDWERFFSDKIEFADIEDVLDKIRKHRNEIAHFKIFDKDAYDESNKLMNRLNKAILIAIKLTEEKDFAEKNAEYLSEIIKPIENFGKKLTQIISTNIMSSLNEIAHRLETVFEQINKKHSNQLFNGIKKNEKDSQEMY